jgi:hypothetical protein
MGVISIPEFKVKRFIVALLLLPVYVAWPQIEAGSVVYVDFAKDEVTIAADSRMNLSSGGHDDTECKISAFGDQFVFAMAGVVRGEKWNAHAVARQLWEAESKLEADPVKLVPAVADKWATRMEEIYRQQPNTISTIRKLGTEALANGIFAATNNGGNLVVHVTNIDFDLRLFDSKNLVRLWHDGRNIPPGTSASGGLDEILGEFLAQSSTRAKDYWKGFIPQISNMTKSQQRASISSKLIELSIRLHPQNDQLGFPVDVLQLRPKTGVSWVSIKPNCPQN